MVSVKTDTNGSKTLVDRSANALDAVYAGASLPDAPGHARDTSVIRYSAGQLVVQL